VKDKSGGRVALVTGAGSGIGRATALLLAERGFRLVVCDLDPAGLAEVAGLLAAKGALLLQQRVDVADRSAMAAFAAAVHQLVPAVDLLVNNAGVGLAASLLDTSPDDWRWLLGINLGGVVHGMELFVPPMVARGRGGQVVNVASGLGLVAAPGVAAYATSKFAVVGLSEAARLDLAPHGIGVSCVCPGIINTPIVARTPIRGKDPERLRQLAQALFSRRNYPPERVAEAVVAAAEKNRGLVTVTLEATLSHWLKRLMPWALPALARLVPR
jgi:NAD(P)-dependent dehydrogenase (short-subunit alcohol dehydrogenase family)